ncbi:hypothetical protein J2125_000611 [Erwinia toletana]|uniref:Uncharacterized protein n=1 Tax=Winslowiella toletana TaxID=92490 RepID=A0ABS4P441_9GAMM|nr:hypothetical protein [Winslowiella toletana]
MRKIWLAYRDSYLQLNHGFLTRGYREWLRRFL